MCFSSTACCIVQTRKIVIQHTCLILALSSVEFGTGSSVATVLSELTPTYLDNCRMDNLPLLGAHQAHLAIHYRQGGKSPKACKSSKSECLPIEAVLPTPPPLSSRYRADQDRGRGKFWAKTPSLVSWPAQAQQIVPPFVSSLLSPCVPSVHYAGMTTPSFSISLTYLSQMSITPL